MTSEIPDYAKNNGNHLNWLKLGKSMERTAFYKSQYEKEKVKMEASQKLSDFFKDVETAVTMPPQKIASGDTLSGFFLRSFKSEALMWQGLKNLQEQGYQVDWFPEGYTVEISNNRLSLFKTVSGEKIYFKSPETGISVKELKVFDLAAESVDEITSIPRENPLIEERWTYVLGEVQTSLGEEFTLSTVKNPDSSSGLDRALQIHFNGRTEEILITHADGITVDNVFSNDALTVSYRGNSYPTVGRAAYAASLKLKPEEPKIRTPFSVDEHLPLDEQWLSWKKELMQKVVEQGMRIEFKKEKDARIKLVIHNGDRKESLVIQRFLARKTGGYTSKDARITWGEDEFSNPVEGLMAILESLKNPKKELEITWPWEPHQHAKDPHADSHDSHDGHIH